MSAQRARYAGDETLAALLAEAGAGHGVAEIRALVAGVNAAPPGADPDAWLCLVAPTMPAELAHQLRLLRALMAPPAEHRPAPDRALLLVAFRAELGRRGLDGFVVPRADEHQGEYVPACAERLAWLTGFTGSAGVAVILAERAAIFVDGRYTLQVREEVPADVFEHRHLMDEPHAEWAATYIGAGGRLGYDPRLHTIGWAERMRAALARAEAELVGADTNPVDAIWRDRPPPPIAPVVPHDTRFAGRQAADKQAAIAKSLADRGLDATVLTQPDSIAWLLNVRGGDVPCTPLPLSFAILTAAAGLDLFIDRRKLVPGLEAHLGNRVVVRAPEELGSALDALGRAGARVGLDPGTASIWIFDHLAASGARVERDGDPCMLPKACKNAVELEGARAAHRRDGVALARFLAWLGEAAPSGEVLESAAARRLLELRSAGEGFRGASFETISGAGANGAIVHYRVRPETDRALVPGSLYLIDSGAQYLDGTTDVTRTVAIGEPTAEMRTRFTLVLKGHIALATARFPSGTTGSQLDTLARQFLWGMGLDYDHGTGHGVGSYLSVHEGPQRISKLPNSVALAPGMIVSNEPGYYRPGAYGIRIENLVAVQPCPNLADAERPMLCFETLTFAPIDRRLIDPTLLTAAERAWVDAYHASVGAALADQLDAGTARWLATATAPLAG